MNGAITFTLPAETYESLVELAVADVLDRVTDRLRLGDNTLLNTCQAGEYLGYSDVKQGAQRIRDLAYKGLIDSEHDGKRLLVRRAELERYLASQKESR